MRQITIRSNEAGQRLDKFLQKYMKEAPASFFYKMMRKKNILLNGKKCAGSEKLAQGDCIRLYLAQETLEKFGAPAAGKTDLSPYEKAYKAVGPLPVLWENEHALAVDKPVGLLSQKACPGDLSLNEWLIGYLLQKGDVFAEELSTFRPSVCNRLDRNTSGILAAGKTLASLQELSRLFRDRILGKYYLCLVKGSLVQKKFIKGYLHKEEKCNKVVIKETPFPGAGPIETSYEPLAGNGEMTLLRVHLITGRTHQIRSHLSYEGHPILGDPKYGDQEWNQFFYRKYGLRSQLLHAAWLKIPKIEGTLGYLSGRQFFAPLPKQFADILKKEHLEESIDNEDMARNLGIR